MSRWLSYFTLTLRIYWKEMKVSCCLPGSRYHHPSYQLQHVKNHASAYSDPVFPSLACPGPPEKKVTTLTNVTHGFCNETR